MTESELNQKGNHVYRDVLDKYSQEDIDDLSEQLSCEDLRYEDLSTEESTALIAYTVRYRDEESPPFKQTKIEEGDPIDGKNFPKIEIGTSIYGVSASNLTEKHIEKMATLK